MVPFFFGPYRVSQFTLALIYAVAVLGLNLLVGYSGQISLGHGAFFRARRVYVRNTCSTALGSTICSRSPPQGSCASSPGSRSGSRRCACAGCTWRSSPLGFAVGDTVLIRRFDSLTGGSQGIAVEQPEPLRLVRAG